MIYTKIVHLIYHNQIFLKKFHQPIKHLYSAILRTSTPNHPVYQLLFELSQFCYQHFL